MAPIPDHPPLVFTAPADWTFPTLGSRVVPAGARVDTVVDETSWSTFDTPAGNLRRHGADLSQSADGSWRLRFDGVDTTAPSSRAGVVPAPLRDLLLGMRAGAPLRREAKVDGRRVTRVVVTAEDAVLGEIDDVSQRPAGAEQSRCIEVIAVDAAFGAAVTRRLTRAGAEPVQDKTDAPETVGEAVRRTLAERQRDVIRGDVRLRRGDDAIHSTRVAIRRLRSVLRVVDVFDADRVTLLDAELRWLSVVLGGVRDTDVLREHLVAAVDDLPDEVDRPAVRAAIDAGLDEQAARARAVLGATLRGKRYLTLLAELQQWVDAPPLTDAADKPVKHLAAMAEKATRTMRKRIDAATTTEEVHRARKAAKRARYVGEFAAEVLGGAALRKGADRAKKVQTELGDRQDAVVAGEFVASLIRRTSGLSAPAAFGLGVLWTAERAAAGG